MFHDADQQLHILQLNDLYNMSIVTIYHEEDLEDRNVGGGTEFISVQIGGGRHVAPVLLVPMPMFAIFFVTITRS